MAVSLRKLRVASEMAGADLGLSGFQLILVLIGALVAGFTSGVAGFGTALVASGLWFHALPAATVPPLVTLTGMAAQVVGLITVRGAFAWQRTAPFMFGGIFGVPLGIALLVVASADMLRLAVAVFLVTYAGLQLVQRTPHVIGDAGGRAADALVGFFGGILGGFAGLSGALPLVWLQLRGGTPDAQRATYQPFNLVMLALAALGMGLAGQISRDVVFVALVCLPVTLAGAWLGARTYGRISAAGFRRIVLGLLVVSGAIMLIEAAVR